MLLGLLLLIAVGVLVWYFASRDDNSTPEADASAPGGITADGTVSPAGATGAAGTGTGSGTITVGDGSDLLTSAADSASLGAYEGETITANTVDVLSVVADEGFWTGVDESQRVFVRIDTTGESAIQVDVGDQVSFRGTLEVLPLDFEGRFGVTADEGAEQLRSQGYYVSATELTEAAG
jgi:hypothetical protein